MPGRGGQQEEEDAEKLKFGPGSPPPHLRDDYPALQLAAVLTPSCGSRRLPGDQVFDQLGGGPDPPAQAGFGAARRGAEKVSAPS